MCVYVCVYMCHCVSTYHIVQSPCRYRLAHVLRLIRVQRRRRARRLHIAKGTPTRARIAHDHDRRRGGALSPPPAFANIGAFGFLTHRGQLERSDGVPQPLVVLALGDLCFEPAGLGEGRFGPSVDHFVESHRVPGGIV
jgi:hypothetical protein